VDATVADPVIGRLLDGRYTAQERLAVGGMATVYVAHDNRLDRLVALKVMHPNLMHDPDFVARFQREAMAVARLNTPRVVSVLDQGSDRIPSGPVNYLVMELVRGRSLRQHLGARGRLTVPEAIEIIEPVIEALAAAHAAGILHRDIKPENILLGDDGQVKVADFGLARPVTQPTQALSQGVVMGTVGYLAPEQVAHGTSDTRSDVYAAGVVLFEVLTGQLPHSGATPMSVAYQSVHGDVPAPSTIVPGIPPALDDFVLRATARDPARRPTDGGALLDEFLRILPYLPQPEVDDYPSGYTAVLEQPASAGTEDGRRSGPPPTPTSRLGPAPGRRRAQRPGSARRTPVLIALAAVLALVLGIVAVKALTGGGGGVETPLLTGLDQKAAEKELRDAGLSVSYGPKVTSDTVAAGHVAGQDPKDGTRLDRGATVTLHLSSGPAQVAVPDVKGLPEQDARTKLQQMGLLVDGISPQTSLPSDNIPPGHVIGTKPAAGATVNPGDQVTLIISTGVSGATVPPDVVGKSFEDAKTELEGLGLTATRQDIPSNDVEPGKVVRTSPDPGQPIAGGGTVTLFVSGQGSGDNGGDGEVQVPDVRGKSYDDAVSQLTALGLQAKPEFAIGTVTKQLPGPGRRVHRGSTVRLTVSLFG
jgi:eukaryotic-like serine/threonine-protein kinase